MPARIQVRVQPGASRDAISALSDGTVRVAVTAPALDGRANKAACTLIAKRLRVAPSRVAVVRGAHARLKLIEVDGFDQAALSAAIAAASSSA